MGFSSLLDGHPLTAGHFVKWLLAREADEPMDVLLKCGWGDLPADMQYGTLVRYCHEQRVHVGMDISKNGRFMPKVRRRRLTGTWTEIPTRSQLYKAMDDARNACILSAFAVIEHRLRNAARPVRKVAEDVVTAGWDMNKVLARAQAIENQLKGS